MDDVRCKAQSIFFLNDILSVMLKKGFHRMLLKIYINNEAQWKERFGTFKFLCMQLSYLILCDNLQKISNPFQFQPWNHVDITYWGPTIQSIQNNVTKVVCVLLLRAFPVVNTFCYVGRLSVLLESLFINK